MSVTNNDYIFDAFISYDRCDRKAAVAYQKNIERYRVPKGILNERKRIKIFRDEDNLPGGSLKIHDNLDASAKLIVICSSEASNNKSEWVKREVQHFIEKGRLKDIIPLVLNGAWRDVLPENLKDEGIEIEHKVFICDYFEQGKHNAFLRVISGILGLDNHDDLVQKDKRRRRQNTIITTIISLLIVLASALYINYNYFPHTTYYADYDMYFGRPEGINELNTVQHSLKQDVFAITITRNSREIRLEHTNSQGLLSEDFWANHVDAPTIAIYKCNSNWQANVVEYFDADSKILQTFSYAPDMSYVDLIKSKDDATWLTATAGNNDYGLPVRTNISRYLLKFDEDGRLTQKMFAVDRLAAIDETGIGGEGYFYNSLGRLSFIQFLDVDGEPVANKFGVAGEQLSYDDFGNCYRIDYLNINGESAYHPSWYASAIESYNADGNKTECRYFDVDGNLTITAMGYAIETYEYSDKGFITATTYFGVNNEPIYSQYKFHRVEIERDDLGRDISTSYFDTGENLTLISAGYAKRVNRYNEKGQLVEQYYYGADGNPRLNDSGVYKVLSSYDENGYNTEIAHYGVDSKLICSIRGYAVIRMSYNDLGLQTSHSYFGVYGEAIIGNEGYHKMEFIYDNRNNVVEILLSGTLEQPVLSSSGWAIRKLKYDNAGNILEDAYFDDYNTPTYIQDYIHRATFKYNERGNRTVTEYVNPDGTPVSYHSVTNGVISYDKAYRLENDYDSVGNRTESRIYRMDGSVNKYTYEYDNIGRIITEHADIDGVDVDMITRYEYDEQGNIIEKRIDGSLSSDHGYIREYDTRGNITREARLNALGEIISSFFVDFNNNNAAISTTYYDENGHVSRVYNPEGVARVEADYNERNLKIERRFYDENNQAMLNNEGYARSVMAYDRYGNLTDTVFYDLSDRLVINSARGYARLTELFDDYSRLLERTYYDNNNAQLVRVVNTYDEYGNCTSNAMYNRQNELQGDQTHKVAKNVYYYDDYGYIVGQEWYGSDGELMAPFGLYAKYMRMRENGRTTRIEYFNENKELTLNQYGYAIEVFSYDERGNESGRAFFGIDGQPVLLKWRFSSYEVVYDEHGNIDESKFYDTVGREVPQVDGHLQKTEAVIRNIPQKTLMFYGNDGSSLMGEIEIKIYTPLTVWVEPLSVDTESLQDNNQDSLNEDIFEESLETEQSSLNFSEREYIVSIDKYIRAIENFDGVELMDSIDQSLILASSKIAASQLGVEISDYKIYYFYASFYSKKLKQLEFELMDKYGQDIYITYELVSEDYQSAQALSELNQALESLGIDNIDIQEMVFIGIVYTVCGTEKSGIEDINFFSSPLALIKINNNWGIGSSEGFPHPERDDLIKLYLT